MLCSFFFCDLCANVRSRVFFETITFIQWSCFSLSKFTGLLVIVPSILYTVFTPSCFILSAHDVSICEFKHILDKFYYIIQSFFGMKFCYILSLVTTKEALTILCLLVRKKVKNKHLTVHAMFIGIRTNSNINFLLMLF